MPAAYLSLTPSQWRDRARVARALLRSPCHVCPRYCRVDRSNHESRRVGFCRAGPSAIVHSYSPHLGEEDCLRGWSGSGTIFFSSCNLACVYCQNWEISQERIGHEVSRERLAAMMLELQGQGCHNVNLVTPSPYVPQIVEATRLAVEGGLRIPLVYNTSSYDSPESLQLLDGMVDIYLADLKYSDDQAARRLSLVTDYWSVARRAVGEMHRQVGDLVIGEDGLALRGVLVRHLVLPGGLAGTREVARFLVREVSPDSYINIMGQYRPAHRAAAHPLLRRSVTHREMEDAMAVARSEGLRRFDGRAVITG